MDPKADISMSSDDFLPERLDRQSDASGA